MDRLQAAIQAQVEISSILPSDLQYVIDRGRGDIVLFANVLLGMPLHPGQIKFYRNGKKKINLLLPSNRWGKTLTVAIKHIHKNFYKVGIGMGDMKGWAGVDYRTADIAPASSQTEMCFNYVKQILQGRFPIPQPDGSVKNNECLIRWFLDEKHIINNAPFIIPYTNNSRTEFRSTGSDKGDSLQSKPYGYISYDEGGRSDHLQTEIWGNIIPRLTDWGGELDIPCTPDTNSHSILYHYQLFQKGMTGDPDVYSQEGSIDDNIFLPKENIEESKRLYKDDPLGPQVLYGKFVFSGANIFATDDILAAQTESIEYGNKSVVEGMKYLTGHQYMIGIDTSIGSDECVYTVIDVTRLEDFKVVNKVWSKGNAKSPQLHQLDLLTLWDLYNHDNNVKISLETWNGESARFYMDMPKELQRKTKCFGSWQPPGTPKKNRSLRLANQASLIVALCKKLAARELHFAMADEKLTQQLSIYREDDGKLETDHVFSLALAVFRATDGKPKVTRIQYVAVAF